MKFFTFYAVAMIAFTGFAHGRVIDASPSFFHYITTSRSRPDVSNRYREAQVKSDLDNSYTDGRHLPVSDDHRGSADQRRPDQIYSIHQSNPREGDNSGNRGDSEEYRSSRVDSPTPTSDATTSTDTSSSSTTTDSTSSTATTTTVPAAPTSCTKLINVKASILDSVVALCLL
ncbi:hypothetical protein K7432_010843 [Basidiobolus ranarum]|uniref:Uncharacterized protein n=1 Tax=Basidiobolus ranarum TaxID=34480 RepID=A0ABR2WN22_9FUNG